MAKASMAFAIHSANHQPSAISHMPKVLILGAGGHAQVVADILMRAHEAGSNCEPIGFLDDNPPLTETVILGLPVLGAIAQLDEFDHGAVIVAIGDNRTRARLFESVRARGEEVVNAVHPAAMLAPDVCLGQGVMICAGVVVNTGTVIGDNVILNTGCTVDHHNHVGNHAQFAPGVHLGGDVTIGEGTVVGIGASVISQRTIGAWSGVVPARWSPRIFRPMRRRWACRRGLSSREGGGGRMDDGKRKMDDGRGKHCPEPVEGMEGGRWRKEGGQGKVERWTRSAYGDILYADGRLSRVICPKPRQSLY